MSAVTSSCVEPDCGWRQTVRSRRARSAGLAMLAFLVVVGNAVAALALLFFTGSMFVSSP